MTTCNWLDIGTLGSWLIMPKKLPTHIEGHLPHEPRAVTMKLWESEWQVSRACPNTPPKSCSVVTDPQVLCEVTSDRALYQMLLHWYSIWLKKIKKSTVMSIQVPCSPRSIYVRPTSKRWFLKNSPSDHITWSIGCHVGIQADLSSILHSHIHSIGPSSVAWSSELGLPAPPPLPPMRVLEV